MRIRLVSWNINSVRLRMPLVEQFVEAYNPDILCLQETKVDNDKFPRKAFAALGYEHMAIHGQKGYHGVATLSRLPIIEQSSRDVCEKGDARHIMTEIEAGSERFTLHNFYVPAGGDDPNPETNEKFAHKLAFLDEMQTWLTGEETDRPAILVGDLNIAPLETDVWSHKQLLKVVSHTPIEVEALTNVQEAGPWVDTMRRFIPREEKLFTWWSYRSPKWAVSDKGRRLDHVWATPQIADKVSHIEVVREARGWERPSDHAPVICDLEL